VSQHPQRQSLSARVRASAKRVVDVSPPDTARSRMWGVAHGATKGVFCWVNKCDVPAAGFLRENSAKGRRRIRKPSPSVPIPPKGPYFVRINEKTRWEWRGLSNAGLSVLRLFTFYYHGKISQGLQGKLIVPQYGIYSMAFGLSGKPKGSPASLPISRFLSLGHCTSTLRDRTNFTELLGWCWWCIGGGRGHCFHCCCGGEMKKRSTLGKPAG